MITENDVYFLEGNDYDKDSILRFASDEAEEKGIVSSSLEIYEDFLEREKVYTTSVLEKIAIPHAVSPHVVDPKVFFIRLDKGIEWDSPEDYKANLIFVIFVPKKDAGTTHLEIISSIAEKLLEDDFVEALEKMNNKKKIAEYILK